MGKSILRGPVPKDDPMFSTGPELISHPRYNGSSTSTAKNTTGATQDKSASAEKGWSKQEAQDQQRLQLAMEEDLLATLEPTSPMKKEKTSKK